MDWSMFSVAALASAFLVYPGFEFFQFLSVKAKQIPPRGTTHWKGRQFFHWDRYKTLLFGDLIFLSLFNGFAVSALVFLWNAITPGYVAFFAFIAAVITASWFVQAKRRFASGNMRTLRWDSAFTAPDGRSTICGIYHLVYFFVEAFLISFSVMFLMWMPVDWFLKFGMAGALFAYVIALWHDVHNVGMFLGPIGDSQKNSS